MELVRQKGIETRIVFPLKDLNGDLVSGATGLDSEYTYWADDTNPVAFSDCTNEATEIGTSGWYYLILTASEMDHDYVDVKVISSGDTKPQGILIKTFAKGYVIPE